jgi:5-methylcytosine-specific restriction endonuclease McrBC regulatory subunit McrC
MSAKKIGINVSFSLIINSNILFERYIFNFLQQKFSQDTFKYKNSLTIANLNINNKAIKIEPDIIYKGSHDVIIDVKNKNFDKAILNSDFYQIYTYCKALNTDTGILIYPYYEDTQPIIINLNFDDKIRIYGLGIDITKSLDIDRNQAQNRFLENIKALIFYG